MGHLFKFVSQVSKNKNFFPVNFKTQDQCLELTTIEQQFCKMSSVNNAFPGKSLILRTWTDREAGEALNNNLRHKIIL